ncbi:CotH kinase family protein [Flammeovirga agarivorans]|uniref:CotH protein n=1 Tax=Flammeovirga agarivorans TaxID=2726742 RepID=A0A7X8SHC3_9BACT|nr:CotH kinase family protein [Flammeovirga agarivorans]NLR90128.1 hypothetical protein [Flammeovirga agarivorans]
MKKFVLTILLIYITILSYAQCTVGHECSFFHPDEVSRIDITLDSAELQQLLAVGNEEKQLRFFGSMTFESKTIKDTISSICVGLSGKDTRYSLKKSFEIAFGKKSICHLQGLKLESNSGDPTLSRSKLMYQLMSNEGIPAPRSAHTLLFINGEYHGVYLMSELIDSSFLTHHFKSNEGILYMGNYGADLTNDPNSYLDEKTYPLCQGKDFHREHLQSFLDSINLLHHKELIHYVETHFEVEQFVKALAIEILCGHWDGYAFNKDNFFLYFDDKTGKWSYIPYQFDHTFGINLISDQYDWASRDINQWGEPYEARVLVNKILDQPKYRNLFNRFIEEFVLRTFNISTLSPYLNKQREMLLPFVENDYQYSLDHGWTTFDFINSFENSVGNHIDYGLKEFILQRSRTALKQVISSDPKQLSHWVETVKFYPDPKKNVVMMKMKDVSYKSCMVSVQNKEGQTVKRFVYPPSESIKVEYDKFSEGTYILSAEIENKQGSWVGLPQVIINN